MAIDPLELVSAKLAPDVAKFIDLYRLVDPPAMVRLEPDSTTGNPDPGTVARIADAAWMLGRQWQFGELIGEAQLAVNWEAHPEDVAPLVHAHPTQNEALGEAFLHLAGKPLHAL